MQLRYASHQRRNRYVCIPSKDIAREIREVEIHVGIHNVNGIASTVAIGKIFC